MKKYVAYFRTSTGKQTLGLDAQRTMVMNFLNSSGGTLVHELIEQESGKNDERTGLEKAIEFCETQKCTMIIAKLDRLSRNVSFLFHLRDRVSRSNVEIKALDMPNFSTLTLGIYATIAQHEREIISARTKAALSELKRKGVQLGTPSNLTPEAGIKGIETLKKNARQNVNNRQAQAIIVQAIRSGKKLTETANYLNEMNYKTRNGKLFFATTVRRLYSRYMEETTSQAG